MMKLTAALLVSVLLLSIAACSRESIDVDSIGAADAVKPVDVQVSEVESLLPEVVVLDVRTPEEFAAGHIEGAINIDVQGSDFDTAVAQLDREQTYLVHCAINTKNGRAERAMGTMSELGFNSLKNLEGGYVAWSSAQTP